MEWEPVQGQKASARPTQLRLQSPLAIPDGNGPPPSSPSTRPLSLMPPQTSLHRTDLLRPRRPQYFTHSRFTASLFCARYELEARTTDKKCHEPQRGVKGHLLRNRVSPGIAFLFCFGFRYQHIYLYHP